MWIFSKEPAGKTYEDLIDIAADLCNEFLLVRRNGVDLNENGEKLLIELSNCLIEIKEQQSWPGTELLEGYAKVYYFKLNDVSKELLKRYSKGLYSWKQPLLLEDLCFFKKGRQPWITTISHELFSWIDCNTNDEIKKVMDIDGIELEEI